MKKTILLVEDNPSDEKLTVRTFARCGVENELHVARDGAEALRYLTGDDGEPPAARLPDLVLLDLKLPKIDGLEVLRRVRRDARAAAVPVVILTSSREQEDLARAYAAGANAYVRKPVDYGDLLAAAKAIGVFWLTLNERPPEGA